MHQGPQAPYVEGDMNNAKIRPALRIFNQLMNNEAQVITNHVAAKLTSDMDLNQMQVIPLLESGISLDEVFKVVESMVVNPRENIYLVE